MFQGAERKLSLAEYFLNNLRALAKEAGGFSYIRMDKRNEMRANLDGFKNMIDLAKNLARSKEGLSAPWFAEWISFVRTDA